MGVGDGWVGGVASWNPLNEAINILMFFMTTIQLERIKNSSVKIVNMN